MMDNASKQAEQIKEQIVAEAKTHQQRLLNDTEIQIAKAKEKAMVDVRAEIVALSVACAGKIIGEQLDAKVNAAMVDSYIDKLTADRIGGLPC